MSDIDKTKLAQYIADYIAEEFERGNVEVDRWMIKDAMEAFEGGAGQ